MTQKLDSTENATPFFQIFHQISFDVSKFSTKLVLTKTLSRKTASQSPLNVIFFFLRITIKLHYKKNTARWCKGLVPQETRNTKHPRLLIWKVASLAILWSIWKERNERIFRSMSYSLEELLHAMLLRLAKWVLFRKEFKNLKLDNMLYGYGLMYESFQELLRRNIMFLGYLLQVAS